MFHYSVLEWLLLFYTYCFLGWCFESSYVSIRTGHWVNRGFMRGPFLPLYGSGAIMMLVVSRPFADNLWLTYIAGCIGATLLEFATGAVMERLFKIRYWDYSNQRFNFKGHICLTSSIAWGFMTLLMTRVINEPIAATIMQIPKTVQELLSIVLTVVIAWDFALSFKAAIDLRDVLMKLEQAREDLDEMQQRLSEIVEHAGEQVQKAMEERGAKLEQVREQLADMREHIQAGLTAGYEVRISRLQEFIDENNLESLSEVREEYRQWRKQFYENRLKRLQTLEIRDKFKLHHLLNNPTMHSERFKEAIEEVRRHNRENRDSDKDNHSEQ